MHETSYYKLPVYEPNDTASLMDGYNKAIIKLDSELHKITNDYNLLVIRIKALEGKAK